MDSLQTSADVPQTPTQRSAITKQETLTIKEQLFVAEYYRNGGNGTRAALAVYNTTDENTAATIASSNMRKPKIKTLMKDYKQRMLEHHNITLSRALEPIALALGAKMTVKVKNEEGKTEEVELVDIDTRLKGSDRALKLLGVTETEDGKGNTYNFVQLLNQDHDAFTTK